MNNKSFDFIMFIYNSSVSTVNEGLVCEGKLLGYRVSEVDEWLGDWTPLTGRATLLGFCTVSTQSFSPTCASFMNLKFLDCTLDEWLTGC